MHVVIEDPTGARAVVGIDSVPEHKLRGFIVVGPAVANGDPRTVEEAAQADKDGEAARAAVKKEVLNPKPSGKPAAPKKEK